MTMAKVTDRTTAYAKLIVSGKRICGQAEYLACKRHLDDMANKDFEYIFDVAEAEKHIDIANTLTIGDSVVATATTLDDADTTNDFSKKNNGTLA